MPSLIRPCSAVVAMLLVATHVAATSAAWVAPIPREFEIEVLPGTTDVNGIAMRLAVASTAITPQAASERLTALWRTTSPSVSAQRLGGQYLVSRQFRHWHDTATFAAHPSRGTRITFSRLDLRGRVRPLGCPASVPRDFRLRSHSRSTVAGAAASQCVYASRHRPHRAMQLLAAHWRAEGWRGSGEAIWIRGAQAFRVAAIDVEAGSLVLILGEPE